jgi:hypothetical protein
MKATRFPALVLLLAVSVPAALAQRGSSDTGRGVPENSAAAASSGPSVSSRGISDPGYSGGSAVTARPSFSTAGPTQSYVPSTPNLTNSSFSSANLYWAYQSFLYDLQMRYMTASMYNTFWTRMRNNEPLLTPQILKLALRQPLTLSGRMMRAVDELDEMVRGLQAGKAVSKDEISAKNREIRDLARRVREDNALSFVEQRMDRDAHKAVASDVASLEGVARLRELVTELHTQLKSMYSQNSTLTVSANSLSGPSFQSLSKGIERASKALDAAVKKS